MNDAIRRQNKIIRAILKIFVRIDGSQLSKAPSTGPFIALFNHVNFLDAPVFFTAMEPRPITAFAKVETWDNPIIGKLFSNWETIPIRRNEADLTAIQKALEALAENKILAISPEGHRSGDGQLGPGNPGIVLIALRSKAAIYPMVSYGSEKLYDNLRHLKKTDFRVLVGNPFTIRPPEKGLSREVRKQITDELMYQMAAVLPPDHRGIYSDLSRATEEYLVFTPPSYSNLKLSEEIYGKTNPS
jgi:1-acyl-sn-glycerol-3-phosphate acyltransferase